MKIPYWLKMKRYFAGGESCNTKNKNGKKC